MGPGICIWTHFTSHFRYVATVSRHWGHQRPAPAMLSPDDVGPLILLLGILPLSPLCALESQLKGHVPLSWLD